MIDAKELQTRAKRQRVALTRAWRDARYKQVIGRYVAAGLLTTTAEIEPYRKPIHVAAALWGRRAVR
jgi:hypothetical protein